MSEMASENGSYKVWWTHSPAPLYLEEITSLSLDLGSSIVTCDCEPIAYNEFSLDTHIHTFSRLFGSLRWYDWNNKVIKQIKDTKSALYCEDLKLGSKPITGIFIN